MKKNEQLTQPAGWRPAELAIVVPTLNERPNIVPLLERLGETLSGVAFEVIFVDDDSTDGTPEEIRAICQTKPNVRLLHRIGRRGLASACIEGMLAASAPYVAVMDADLQHDESVLPQMWEKIRSGEFDLVIGSRHASGGSMGEFSSGRVALSNLGLMVSRLVSKHELGDPMSGFFVVTREFIDRVVRRTTGVGFKILLDLVASSPTPVRFAEVPFTFRTRQLGQSKLDINVGLEYLFLVADKLIGRWVPVRFILFCLVGTLGVGLHLGVLYLLYRVLGASFDHLPGPKAARLGLSGRALSLCSCLLGGQLQQLRNRAVAAGPRSMVAAGGVLRPGCGFGLELRRKLRFDVEGKEAAVNSEAMNKPERSTPQAGVASRVSWPLWPHGGWR